MFRDAIPALIHWLHLSPWLLDLEHDVETWIVKPRSVIISDTDSGFKTYSKLSSLIIKCKLLWHSKVTWLSPNLNHYGWFFFLIYILLASPFLSFSGLKIFFLISSNLNKPYFLVPLSVISDFLQCWRSVGRTALSLLPVIHAQSLGADVISKEL